MQDYRTGKPCHNICHIEEITFRLHIHSVYKNESANPRYNLQENCEIKLTSDLHNVLAIVVWLRLQMGKYLNVISGESPMLNRNKITGLW